eukprot:4677407-Prymnesium_polylepis.1
MKLCDVDGRVRRLGRIQGGEQGVDRPHRQVWPACVSFELLGEVLDPEDELAYAVGVVGLGQDVRHVGVQRDELHVGGQPRLEVLHAVVSVVNLGEHRRLRADDQQLVEPAAVPARKLGILRGAGKGDELDLAVERELREHGVEREPERDTVGRRVGHAGPVRHVAGEEQAQAGARRPRTHHQRHRAQRVQRPHRRRPLLHRDAAVAVRLRLRLERVEVAQRDCEYLSDQSVAQRDIAIRARSGCREVVILDRAAHREEVHRLAERKLQVGVVHVLSNQIHAPASQRHVLRRGAK